MKISTLGAAILAAFVITGTAHAQADITLKLTDLNQAISVPILAPSGPRWMPSPQH